MEGLRPSGAVPVSRAAVVETGSVDDALDRQRLGTALTSVVLYPIVVELVLKHLWEQERGTTAARSHDVHGLFEQLGPETRRAVGALYAGCCQAYTDAIASGQRQHGAEAVAVNMASLEEALRWNGEAVKNLKYEMAPRGRSVPTGMFWSSDHMWVVPGTFPNFAIELTRWAAGRDP